MGVDFICWSIGGGVGQKGGCIIVDSTRKGKKFPDSMSKTIPIWTCVLNRAVARNRRLLDHSDGSATERVCGSMCVFCDEMDGSWRVIVLMCLLARNRAE